jgi:hypothetical protein
VGSNIIGQYTYVLTNNAQESTSNKFEFKFDANRKNSISTEIWTEPEFLGQTMEALANSTPWLLFLG